MKNENIALVKEVCTIYYGSGNMGNLSKRDLFVLICNGMINSNDSLSLLADALSTRNLRELTEMSDVELSMSFGLNDQDARKLCAIFEFAKRYRAVMNHGNEERVIVRSPADAVNTFEHIRYLDREHFVVSFLNTKNMVIGTEKISIGSVNASIVHPREVFNRAIRMSASGIICCHQHPSGDPTPSPEDIELTKRLVSAGELLGIRVLDHLILGSGQRYVSLKESGHF
ncbi:DNA repair protein RadC [Paenibacillus sp. yr247]|uniref:JAB domain-containing protein n=1 Tax=Paenibacillus sp. yr247 TaxID=1761880 RepID=UPI00088071FE|nr:DNA repair protein RadC [Paenibacillus sp. yr247]SDO18006.1 DNA repair protein RadC [Paenibacillus sp. yr247]